jgi:competence protein ComEC
MKKRNIILIVALFAISAILFILLSIGIMGAPASNQAPLFPENAPPSKPIPPGCGLLKIYVINVSQADSILIITPSNKTILIDAGSAMRPNSSANVVAFLERMGISRIDALVATHYHEDHIGGMEKIFNNFEVGSVYDNGNCGNYSSGVQKELQEYEKNYTHVVVSHNTELNIDSCLSEAKLIAPYDRPEGCWSANSENDNSVLLHLVYGNTSALFTGDCEGPCEQALINKGALHSDFLKVGHHGSATASSPAFLSAVGATYYAVSTDKIRSIVDGYFLPRQESLGNIYAQDPQGPGSIFRTDLNGDITAISDGSKFVVVSPSSATKCALFSGYSESKASSYGHIPSLASECG